MGLAHDRQAAEPQGIESRGSPTRAASLDESSLASDLALDHGTKTDILSSMATEEGPPFPRGSAQQSEPQPPSSYSSHPINIIEGAEGIASDIYHGAGHVFQQVEEKAGQYIHVPEIPTFGEWFLNASLSFDC